MKKTKMQKGITLVALILTIVVLLILAVVAIGSIQNDKIVGHAQNASKSSEIMQIMESMRLEISDIQIANNGKITSKQFAEICAKYGEVSGSGNNKVITTKNGAVIKVSEVFPEEKLDVKKVSILDVFDINGDNPESEEYNSSKLHIGDFVTYDAGSWLEEEIKEIQTGTTSNPVVANGTNEQPSSVFQFGGFSAGNSRNSSVEESYNNQYWRIFDVDETSGVVTLISTGYPEYYRYDGYGNYAYINEYILTGNVNSSAPSSLNLDDTNYKIRNWNSYVNNNQNAVSAKPLTIEMLGNWLEKYSSTNVTADTLTNGTSLENLTGKYENLVKLSSDYMFATAFTDTLMYTYYAEKDRIDNFGGWYCKPIRICIELSTDAKVAEEPDEILEITNENGKTYEYNVWKLY